MYPVKKPNKSFNELLLKLSTEVKLAFSFNNSIY